jgi:UDP-GlcNAc:undecaprenyl-phosphate GlcNAc-1-phosphate transferase
MLDISFGNNILIYGVIASAISFLVTLIATPKMISSLIAQGSVVQDYHKPGRPNVPRPAGPVLLGGIAASEIILYLLTLNMTIMAIMLTTVIAFIIGFIDDRKVLPGWFKPT